MKTSELDDWIAAFFAGDDTILPGFDEREGGRFARARAATAKGEAQPYRLSVKLARPERLRWDEVKARYGAAPLFLGPDRDAWGGPDAWLFRIRGARHRGVVLLMIDDVDDEVDFHGFHFQRYPATSGA